MSELIRKGNYHIASAFSHDSLIIYFYDFIKEASGERAVSYVSGSIPCLWTGGRIITNLSDEYFNQCFEEYAIRNIPVFFTFSNYMITERDLSDKKCNRILKTLSEINGGVIVASDLLARYIRSEYPNITLEASILRSVEEQEERTATYYSSLEKLYDMIVFHPDDVFSDALLSEITCKNKYEILVNEECAYKCPQRRQHDDLLCKYYIDCKSTTKDAIIRFEKTFCPTKKTTFFNADKCALSNEKMTELFQKGYWNFKVQGRANSPLMLLYDICRYIVNEQNARSIYRNISNKFRFSDERKKLIIWKVTL